MRSGEDTRKRLVNLFNYIGNPLANDFDSLIFAEYRSERIEMGVSASTINKELAYVKSMFEVLIRLGAWKKENPLKNIKILKTQEPEMGFLSKTEISLLLNTLLKSINNDVHLVTKICLSTGCRWGEAERLTIGQVSNSKIIFRGRTKNHKSRTVPISENLEEEINKHYKKFERSKNIFEKCYDAYRWCIEKTLKWDLAEGQLTHVLRHSFASHFMMSGGDILVLQKILGHQTVNVTMKYSHFSPEHLHQAVQFNPLSNI